MALQSSLCSERNLLRLKAREQRNQETIQAAEFNPQNAPLFPEPYKTNTGDELSNRIRRMLGSYDDVMSTCPNSIDALPISNSSKQLGGIMPQKPTAYVRPMDGQDQMVNESPELKQSPEHYSPLPELISRSDLDEINISQSLEANGMHFSSSLKATVGPRCVEDILNEMTLSLPPLLASIAPVSEVRSQKSPIKEDYISPRPRQGNFKPPSQDLPPLIEEDGALNKSTHEVVCSSGGETTSSSDSESGPDSDLDRETAMKEQMQLWSNTSVKLSPESPAASNIDWQLGNWITPSHHNSNSEEQGEPLVSQGLPPKPPSYTCRNTTEKSNSQVAFQHKDFPDKKLDLRCESSQNICDHQQSGKHQHPADPNARTTSKKQTKAESVLDCAKATLDAKSEKVSLLKRKDSGKPAVKTKRHPGREHCDSSRKKRTKQFKHDFSPCRNCNLNACMCSIQNPALLDQPPPTSIKSKPKAELCQAGKKHTHKSLPLDSEKPCHAGKGSRLNLENFDQPPKSLLVKVNLDLLSKVPEVSNVPKIISVPTKRPGGLRDTEEKGRDASKTIKNSKKHQNVEDDCNGPAKKKPKYENKTSKSTRPPTKPENTRNPTDIQKQKIKHPQGSAAPKHVTKNSKLEKKHPDRDDKVSEETVKKKHRKSKRNPNSQTHSEKGAKPAKRSSTAQGLSPHGERLTKRPFLKFDDGQYPVKHYIKEAKRLKHKADAEVDKLSKALNYLEAAMFFVESGIIIERDPQISVSSYTMFSETVELLKFVLKLKNTSEPFTTPAEKDFLVLCMKCQCLLQMTMFRHKQKTATTFSKMLSEYFQNSAQASLKPFVSLSKITDNSSSSSPSSASICSSSGSAGTNVTIPQEIEQVALTYVNITALFISALDMWEKSEELARQSSGMLAELDTAVGPLTLTSSMNLMVRYTRQGIHWLRLDSQRL